VSATGELTYLFAATALGDYAIGDNLVADDSGCPTLACCTRPQTPDAIAGQLSGLLWEIPAILNPDRTVNARGLPDPAPVVTVLQGMPGWTYDILIRLRGLIERKNYVGGTIIDGTGDLISLGGTPKASTLNQYQLDVSDPAATYYVNNMVTDDYYSTMQLVDVEFAITAKTGASVTMTALLIDTAEHFDPAWNTYPPTDPMIITPGPDDPPILVLQPYLGQFMQMDVLQVSRHF
jgi:hypothetical protein